jgi:hypothetical protein
MEIAKIIGLFCAGFDLLKTRLRREEAHCLAIHARVQFVPSRLLAARQSEGTDPRTP